VRPSTHAALLKHEPPQVGAADDEQEGGIEHAQPPVAAFNEQLCPVGHSPSQAGADPPQETAATTHTHAPPSFATHCCPLGQDPPQAGALDEQGPV
jgi:hypothetical protein